jgi:hypothetical protein
MSTIPDHAYGLYLEFVGKRNVSVADLRVYVKVPVGVGNHSDIGEEMKKKLKEISEHHSMISLLESIFPGVENGKPEPKPPPHMRKEHIPPNSSDSDQTEKEPPPADLEDSELSDNIKVVAKFKEDEKP